jgi:hypothetical protein
LTAVLSPFATANAATQEARTRDSSGVQIIENSALRDAPVRFGLGDKPLLEVGGVESNPDEEFDHRQGWLAAARLSNGGLAVIDLSRVHYFDAKGKRIRIVGRKGQGPEEFQTLTTICRTRGDTLVLNDLSNRRLSILDENGRIVRTILHGDNGDASVRSCFDDGSFILQRRLGAPRNWEMRVSRLRLDGSIVNMVGTLNVTGFDLVTQTPLRILASGNAVYHANPYASEIRVHDVLGRLRRIIRTADRGERITESLADERLGWTIPNVTAAEREAMMNQRRATPRIAQTWPVFYNVEIGPDGTIWVQDYDPKAFAPPDAWTAIDSTGRIVGRLIFPPRTGGRRPEVQGFGRDYVIVKRFDEDRAQSIAVFPLLRVDGRSR